MELSIGDVLSDDNINTAMESLMEKRDSCGVDGVKLSELPVYWSANGDRIKKLSLWLETMLRLKYLIRKNFLAV